MKFFDKKRMILGCFFLAMGLFLLYECFCFKLSFPLEEGSLHPMAMPKILLTIWCGLSVAYILVPRNPADLKALFSILPKITAIIVSIVLFILLIPYLGFLICGTALLFVLFWLLDYRSILAFIIAIACIVAVWAIFTYAMKIPLPEAVLF